MQVPVLIGMLTTLLHSNTVTATELSKKYELSVRSVYRYIDALNESGVPIVSKLGKNGGFKILEQFKLDAIYFEKVEFERLLFCVNSATQDSVTTSLSDKLLALMRRKSNNYNVLGTKQLIVDAPVGVELQQKIDNLRYAITEKKFADIEYSSFEGKITRRIVEPYCLVMSGGLWYVYCFCRLRNEFRFFKISRILQLAVLSKEFPGRQFEVDSRMVKSSVLKNKEFCNLVLEIQPEAFAAIEDWLGLGVIEKSDKKIFVRANVPYDELLISKVLSLGTFATVVSPKKLKNDIFERCHLMLKMNSN